MIETVALPTAPRLAPVAADVVTMTARRQGQSLPLWFGDPAAPMFGWLHVPDGGSATGAAVLCPPLGSEYKATHSALRALAGRLSDLGVLTLRFDYHGTGDSASELRAQEWAATLRHDVATAVGFVRGCGPARVSVLGVRMGALIALDAVTRELDVDGLVLWDPCSSTRKFVREQRLLMATASAAESLVPDGWVDVAEMLLPADLDLDLDHWTGSPRARRTLLVARSDRPLPDSVERLAALLDADRTAASGQAELLDVESTARVVPSAVVDTVATWIADGADPATSPVDVPATPAVAVVDRTRPEPVTERAAQLGAVFAMVTERSGGAAAGLPTVVMLSVANDHRAATGRLWVELARRLAHDGFRSVRMDLSGMGDSDARTGEERDALWSARHFDDIEDVAAVLAPDSPGGLVLVGLCSSAYQALESGALLGVRAVCAINPQLHFRPPEDSPGDPGARVRQFCIPPSRAYRLKDRPLVAVLRRTFPSLAWRLNGLASSSGDPLRRMQEMVHSGTDLLILAGERESMILRQTNPGAFAQLSRDPGARVETVPRLEHHLPRWAERQLAAGVVERFLVERFVPAPPATGP